MSVEIFRKKPPFTSLSWDFLSVCLQRIFTVFVQILVVSNNNNQVHNKHNNYSDNKMIASHCCTFGQLWCTRAAMIFKCRLAAPWKLNSQPCQRGGGGGTALSVHRPGVHRIFSTANLLMLLLLLLLLWMQRIYCCSWHDGHKPMKR